MITLHTLLDDGGRWRSDLRRDRLDVPEGVRLVIGRRIKRLSAEARRVLTTAAIVERSFHLTLLVTLGDAGGLTATEPPIAARAEAVSPWNVLPMLM